MSVAAGGKPKYLPSEEEERRMYKLTKELLAEHGYNRYEISNYAREGYECKHNVGYWRRENYVGMGIGASSLFENTRFHHPDIMFEYRKCNFEREDEEVLTEKSTDGRVHVFRTPHDEWNFKGRNRSWNGD